MRALVVTSRFPWPPYSGDRLRTTQWLSALAREGDVTLIAPDGVVPADAPPIRFHPARRSPARGARGVMQVLRDDLPLQSLLAAPYRWSDAIRGAKESGGAFDLVVIVLSRLDPWVRPSLNGGRRVLDAIDSLRRNADERAREASPALRWLWRREAKRVARAESDAARAYDRVLVVNADESSEFGEDAIAVSLGVAIRPLEEKPRRYDFGFWGRLAYFANANAAEWLLEDIWPLIRSRRPNATLVIGGAEAPARLRRKAESAGATLLSPVDDVPSLARDVRVALLPVRFGSGQSTKTMEAAEGGCAIVGTSLAFRGVEPLQKAARIASTPAEFAEAAIRLLDDEAERRALTAELRSTVMEHFAREKALDRLAAVAAGVARP